MHLFPALSKKYCHERMSAGEAQRMAQFIAWAPMVFQVSRLMVKFGILDLLRDSDKGLTQDELVQRTKLSTYAVKILTEASLSAGIVLVDEDTGRFSLSKTGWFLLTDDSTRVNMDFNHDVNYRGMFFLEEALTNEKPEGLKTLGNWPTIYEGLSKLPEEAQSSWFGFDHFYSDNSFSQALNIVFAHNPRHLMDVGGNTGRFALRCVAHSADVNVTIVDLPGQIGMMKKNIEGKEGAERIAGYPTDLLDKTNELPKGEWDVIWMSQFLDCFSEPQIVAILQKAAAVMNPNTRLFIMETFWDRQQYETTALCLTMTSVYFTAMANGNSKMYHSEDMARLIAQAGLKVVNTHDRIGRGHSILEVSLP